MKKRLAGPVFLVGVAALGLWLAHLAAPALPGSAQSTPIAILAPAAATEVRGLPTLAPILRKVMPAVVSITLQTRARAEDDPLYKDPFYRRYFGDGPPAERQGLAAGSWIIIRTDRRLILTRNHVVRNAGHPAVALSDGQRPEATLVGADPATDIALLRVSARGLQALPLGGSDALDVGDYVVAIGNPFGRGQAVTAGIVSALGRSGLGLDGYEDFIQTDAAINPGNSEGALVDVQRRVVGINTAIIALAGGNVGSGFAIPVSVARQVAEQIARFGKVTRGRLGVSVSDHPADMPAGRRAGTPPGAMIVDVVGGSPAEKAGLKAGDVIVAVDGRPIVSSDQLRTRVGLTPGGETLSLDVLRNGERLQVPAKITATAL